jgi:hypothetical protein
MILRRACVEFVNVPWWVWAGSVFGEVARIGGSVAFSGWRTQRACAQMEARVASVWTRAAACMLAHHDRTVVTRSTNSSSIRLSGRSCDRTMAVSDFDGGGGGPVRIVANSNQRNQPSRACEKATSDAPAICMPEIRPSSARQTPTFAPAVPRPCCPLGCPGVSCASCLAVASAHNAACSNEPGSRPPAPAVPQYSAPSRSDRAPARWMQLGRRGAAQ